MDIISILWPYMYIKTWSSFICLYKDYMFFSTMLFKLEFMFIVTHNECVHVGIRFFTEFLIIECKIVLCRHIMNHC